jgi:hypothetical protein
MLGQHMLVGIGISISIGAGNSSNVPITTVITAMMITVIIIKRE